MYTIRLNPSQSIQQAIDSVAPGTAAELLLSPGVYREKLIINKTGLTLIGEGNSSRDVVIVNDDYANKLHPADGKEYNTFRTYTMNIIAPNVTLKRLCIENAAGDPVHKGQSVALSVYGDGVLVEDCVLISTQDTLFCGPLPDDLIVRYDAFLKDEERYFEGEMLQLFYGCQIEGSVDFIFGCANAWFYQCDIVSVNDTREIGFVAAPAHSLKQRAGFQFVDCAFHHMGCGEHSVFLARPWRDFGKAMFLDCALSSHIRPEGFDKWNDTARDRTARFLYGGSTHLPNAVPWAKRLSCSDAQALREDCERYFSSRNVCAVSPSNR